MISFLNERKMHLVSMISLHIVMSLVLLIAKLNLSIILFINIIILLAFVVPFLHDYYKRSIFFKEFNYLIQELDNRMYISSIIREANFYEAEIFLESIYLINKQMIEIVNSNNQGKKDFKEYIVLWCHEIKNPLATLKLTCENNKDSLYTSILEEIQSIEDLIDQVLYYTRSEVVDKDLIIKRTSISMIVNNVVRKHKKQILEKKLSLKIECQDFYVLTDTKWMEYVLNQIIANSIKYSRSNSRLEITTCERENKTILTIKDYGVGILVNEIHRVFDKGFTGTNGRNNKTATGMGLYLVKKMIESLGHSIEIESEPDHYTKVTITFPENSMTSVT